VVGLALSLVVSAMTARSAPVDTSSTSPWEQLPPVTRHFVDVAPGEVLFREQLKRDHVALMREKLAGEWFAALVPLGENSDDADTFVRFRTLRGLLDFIADREALVETWRYPVGAPGFARRLSALERASPDFNGRTPTFITLKWLEPGKRELVHYRVEFGFEAADAVLAADRSYQRHRRYQTTTRAILGARGADGRFDALAQWRALIQAIQEAQLAIVSLPTEPTSSSALFLACEFEVDELGHFTRVRRFYRESELTPEIIRGVEGESVQALRLRGLVGGLDRVAGGYRTVGVGDQLLPVNNPIPGQDTVELRVRDPHKPDPRMWNVVEFGEPELVRQTALAQFSLLNAHLDRRRRELRLRRFPYDFVAESVIAGLNIGGGVTSVGFPLGEAARLAYDLTLSRKFIPAVPTTRQMRELFALMTARAQDPELRTRPTDFLGEQDVRELRRRAQSITDVQVQAWLEQIQEEDLKAMIRLARFQQLDAKVTNWLSIVSDAAKVSGASETDLLRAVFNNPYFSVTGEISLNFILAASLGHKVATPLGGYSLDEIARGQAPSAAWLQFLNVTVDVRSVVNTVSAIGQSRADRELLRPFPYAARMGELAAYEIRIFGFPLLMFYKHGLLRRDYQAYTQDYAYGVIGTRIVEHFPDQASFEGEIRAGRVAPLGYVRVPDATGGWRDTRLVVFAHRLPTGRHRGKTALVLYGLKAYAAHSRLVEREYTRYQSYEEALRQGGVVRQLLDAEDRAALEPDALEPRIQVGPSAAEDFYTPVLGSLLELRRAAHLASWGVPLTAEDRAGLADAKSELVARGIQITDPLQDGLLEVDRHFSRFIYRSQVNGHWRLSQATLIPSPADIDAALAAAEEARQVEQCRRAAQSPGGAGIALLHHTRSAGGRLEAGPLVRGPGGELEGYGLRHGAEAIGSLLTEIDRLPVADRARLEANGFAATVLPVDADRDGRVEPVFLTIEFPVTGPFLRDSIDPLTSTPETRSYEGGHLTGIISDHRITQLDYDAWGAESRARVYANAGTRDAPVVGPLIAETHALEVWHRDHARPGLDPAQPRITRLRFDHVTGQTTRETFGLMPSPLITVDDNFVTHFQHTAEGRVLSATVHDNGRDAAAFDRPRLDRVLDPRPGQERFTLRAVVPDGASEDPRLRQGPQAGVYERRDLIRGLLTTLTYDPSRFGRLVQETFTETLGSGESIDLTVKHQYQDDFAFGLIPWRSTLSHLGTGTTLSEQTTVQFDPATRRLTASATDYRGKVTLLTWDLRWNSPVIEETEGRRTTVSYNSDETQMTGLTQSCDTGELIATFAGEFDLAAGCWRIQRQRWHRPEVPLHVEHETRTPHGRLIANRVGELFEVRPFYDATGREVGLRWWGVDPTSGRFERLHREEDDYQWHAGARTARIRTFVEGRPHRLFQSRTDTEGRTVEEIETVWSEHQLSTRTAYDGYTERRREVHVWHDGRLRETRRFQDGVGDGDVTQPVTERVEPFWGLIQTNTYDPTDPLGRPIQTIDERGWSTVVIDWFPGTAIPRWTEHRDSHGQLRERTELKLCAGVHAGLPYDLRTRHRFSPWGQRSLAEDTALLSGTGIVLFVADVRQRTDYDLAQPFAVPAYTSQSDPAAGVAIDIGGSPQAHVTVVYGYDFAELPAQDGLPQEKVLILDAVDLRQLFSIHCQRRTLDKAGNTLALSSAAFKPPTTGSYTAQALIERARQTPPTQLFHPIYEAGWLTDATDRQAVGRTRVFSQTPPEDDPSGLPVNQHGDREWITRTVTTRIPSRGSSGDSEPKAYVERTTDHHRLVEQHPHLPGREGLWIAVTATNWGPDGDRLFDADEYYDVDGELSSSRTRKVTADGKPATRLRYRLPDPAPGEWRDIDGEETELHPNAGTSLDLTDSDFLYLYLENLPTPRLRIMDLHGRTVRVGPDNRAISFWPAVDSQIRWLPDRRRPVQAVSVSAPRQPGQRTVRLISVHDLDHAGLDVRAVGRVVLEADPVAESGARASPLYRLDRQGRFVPDRESSHQFLELTHASGIVTHLRTRAGNLDAGVVPSRQTRGPVEWTLELDDRRIAEARSPGTGPGVATLDLLDHGGTEGPAVLYRLSADSGQILEFYRSLPNGRRYLVPQGFQVPQLEIRRPGVITDELHAGILAYGFRTLVTVPLTRAGPGFIEISAQAIHRIAANAFQQVTPHALDSRSPAAQPARLLAKLNETIPRAAADVADAVNDSPALAAALLPRRPLPWSQSKEDPQPVSNEAALRRMAQAQLREADQLRLSRYAVTGLIPTAPDTGSEPFVDTVSETALIRLAVWVGELSLARDLLSFYWDQTRGGTEWVHAFYDARTGAARQPDPTARRPLHSAWTAEAQTALAEAALSFWAGSGDPRGFILGSNLLSRLRLDFRGSDEPRGISEHPAPRARSILGLRLWPERAVFTTRSNARACVLLRRLTHHEGTVRHYFSDEDWSALVADCDELEAWLKSQVLPHALNTGVVPQGVIEIQDIERGTTALAVERWTTTEDWLRFIEVAGVLGVEAQTSWRWLEHLARVHGVTVSGHWGLDWTLALSRPDMVSTELTARFARVARLLGHEAAADFAYRQLSEARQGDRWPTIQVDAAPNRPLPTVQGQWIWPRNDAAGWPATLLVLGEQLQEELDFSGVSAGTALAAPTEPELERTDVGVFLAVTAAFYGSILAVALFWSVFRWGRIRWQAGHALNPDRRAMSESVMELAEERWVRRVLGAITPPQAPHTRYSNATIEQNFLMQLRAIHKLVVEWRRRENQWPETTRALVEGESDDWLNGLDEFCSMVGLYMRWVIKAGAKDGFRKLDVLEENEDGNHIWSRLVLYFAEYHWALLTLLRAHASVTRERARTEINAQITLLLNAMGLRQRTEGFDARILFDAPANLEAFDLLLLQQPGMTLTQVVDEAARRLRIPGRHIVRFIRNYKQFKQREQPYPLHPFVLECAKVLPHFLLMGIGALIFYNHYTVGDSPVVRYLWNHVLLAFAFRPEFSACGLTLTLGLGLTIAAHWVRIYRWEAAMLPRATLEFPLDRALTSLMPGTSLVLPLPRSGRWWNPHLYQSAAWILRALGFLWLGILLLRLPTPTFVTFLVVKGVLAMIAFAEVAGILLPAIFSWTSRFFQDRVSANPHAGAGVRWLNQLNLTATRPTSLLWQSIRYHFRPSAPSGTAVGMTQGMVFYFVLAALFFGAGVFLCQEMLPLWFSDQYRAGADFKMLVGGAIFWCTMYLLRYGLFLLAAGVAAWFAAFPIKGIAGLLAMAGLAALLLVSLDDGASRAWSIAAWSIAGVLLTVLLLESPLVRLLRKARVRWRRKTSGAGSLVGNREGKARLAVVYMSGDALSSGSLTPELLLKRWCILRDRLDSTGQRCLDRLLRCPDDAALLGAFASLASAERRHDLTLWHPSQLVVSGEQAALSPSLGLNLVVDSPAEKEQLLMAWQARRWLATMMSTAGHSQDTAIDLVDIALRLDREGLAGQTVFYLIQNKFDSGTGNRPAQTPYDRGELGQREKLARLICALAPEARAYSLQNWTPFGFKAGGLTGMDLVPDESLRLSAMLLLDRNAAVHDLDGLMTDVRQALADPDLIVVIPRRGTTNTRTSIGQASQMVEEGHGAFLGGLVRVLGGDSSECLGTGWGNLMAYGYGEVQRALLNVETPLMPLTSRMHRGTSFRLRLEGLIGFGPHAVGISEDTWAVSQATHNAVAFGRRVRFAISHARWHKIRETWSHAEWLNSFPRWSGGYFQMMHDPLMQRINDFGPLSVFARDLRASSGRFYLSALVALFNILLLPLAIILDVTPFVQILILLWNVGFIINQVLTLHSLEAFLENAGFHRGPALGGAAIAAGAAAFSPTLQFSAPAFAVLGFLVGGFVVGLGRWLATRLRDVILFGPQLVLHALGQCVRQSLEFTMSGASPHDALGVNMAFRSWVGPREDRPLLPFPGPINLKVVVWGVGLVSLMLNLIALSRLDLLNVLMLLPSLLFSVSALTGPFLMTPLRGRSLGALELPVKIAGWLGAFLVYVMISRLLALSGSLAWLGLALMCAPFILIARHAMRYAAYRPGLRRAQRRLTDLLTTPDLRAPQAGRVAERLIQKAVDASAPIDEELKQTGLPASRQDIARMWIETRLRPLLRAPLAHLDESRILNSRWISVFSRGFVLGWFVLLWFFLVPVPGLFVVSAGDYRVSTLPGSMMTFLGVVVGGAAALAGVGELWRCWIQRRQARHALTTGFERAFVDFREMARRPNRLTHEQCADLHGLFIDALLYLDQRADVQARRCLEQIRLRLATARQPHVSVQ
jgi:hypothetical protein